MNKTEINPMPQFFDRYINLVQENDFLKALETSKKDLEALDIARLKRIDDKVYAPGKWTVKDIFQHIIDNERIQSYRALRFSRKDQSVLPGYDQDLLAKFADTANRSIEDLMQELMIVRQSTMFLFRNLTPDMYLQKGICFNVEISALALGFVIIGHQTHHLNVIRDKYYPLA